jgi:multicomponent K+:H+ antiporter subunit A
MSFFFGKPFLTHTFGHWHIPLLGELELASAMSYDFGVYLSVVGATLMILANFAHVSRDNTSEEFK